MHVTDFYDRYPIDAAHVLASALSRRTALGGRLTADDLFDFDQDHYGGLTAVDVLARRARLSPASRVLDVCAGLGGPARFLADRRGCRVIGLELHSGRAAGAARLTRRVGLTHRVAIVRGNAVSLPFAGAAFDACLGQEAFLHIEDKPAVLAECRRVLVTAGRFVFTDWIARPRLSESERARLREWMAATTLVTLDEYRRLLGRAGFTSIDAEEISDEWRPLLRARLGMYRAMRADIIARFGEARYEEYRELYAFFVGLVESGRLGGGRFSATA